MDRAENHELLGDDKAAQEDDSLRFEPSWNNLNNRTSRRSCNTWLTWRPYRTARYLYSGLFISSLVVALFLFTILGWDTTATTKRNWPNLSHPFSQAQSTAPPFTGAFARFPRLSELPERQRRITMIGVWNGDTVPTYMRQHFYGLQLNADVIDYLLINRLVTEDQHCMDFEKAGINITWGGNIKVHCMDNNEWKRRHADFMCSSEYGWNCSPTEYDEVMKEWQQREDPRSFNWRPFRGHVFYDLFENPENPFWAWLDLDIQLGNFARYPFNILSQLSLLTGASGDEPMFLAGQLTAFNLDDKALGTAWKRFPELKSPDHFTKYTAGKMPESAEERYWSYGYLRSDEELPGTELSYGIYPNIHGDDFYDHRWNGRNSEEVYVVSGRAVLLTSKNATREEIEGMLELDRNDPVDDFGGIGWTGGEDGSAYLLAQPSLDPSEAKKLAVADAERLHGFAPVHNGIIEDKVIDPECLPKRWSQCVPAHPLTVSNPPLMRTSLLRFKGQTPNHVLRRLERDNRPRGYERKLLKHHQRSKRLDWFEFPDYDITEDLVLRYNFDFVEVFKMGPSRNDTMFYRKKGATSIG